MNRILIFAVAILSLSVICALPIAAIESPQLVQIPAHQEAKDGKKVTVLVDDEGLKLATIFLNAATPLPAHSTPVPATIHVLEGEGAILVEGKEMSVTPGSIVILGAGQEHEVVPSAASHMLLLVHYLRGGETPHSAEPAHQH